jgi:hypothetical protein
MAHEKGLTNYSAIDSTPWIIEWRQQWRWPTSNVCFFVLHFNILFYYDIKSNSKNILVLQSRGCALVIWTMKYQQHIVDIEHMNERWSCIRWATSLDVRRKDKLSFKEFCEWYSKHFSTRMTCQSIVSHTRTILWFVHVTNPLLFMQFQSILFLSINNHIQLYVLWTRSTRQWSMNNDVDMDGWSIYENWNSVYIESP